MRSLAVVLAVAAVATIVAIDVYQVVRPPESRTERQESDHERLSLPASKANPSATGACGIELWRIKTLTDPRADAVDLVPHRSSIAALTSRTAPRQARSRPRDLGDVEGHAYRVAALLTGYKLEADSDLHLVLDDSAGRTMIAELPDPACAVGSRVLPQIAQARARFTATHNPVDGCFGCLHERVVVTGVGFFDKVHGQTGVAPNGVELHPLLSFRTG